MSTHPIVASHSADPRVRDQPEPRGTLAGVTVRGCLDMPTEEGRVPKSPLILQECVQALLEPYTLHVKPDHPSLPAPAKWAFAG
jgi:hypothetical protein